MQPMPKRVSVPGLCASAGAGHDLPFELALWLERALGAVGLRQRIGNGGPPERANEIRDAVLRALAQRFYPGVPVSTQAARIRARADAYAYVEWPRDRERTQIPARYRGTPEEYLWAAFRSGAPMPLPTRVLRRILIGMAEEA